MKTKSHLNIRTHRQTIWTKRIRYILPTPNGAQHCSTEVVSLTRAGLRQADRAFFATHTHVNPA